MPERAAPAVVALARDWIAGAAGGRVRGRRRAAEAEGRPAKPWFAWVHLFDPHAPYRPPPPFDAQYAGRPYYGEVAATDAALAPLLDDLRASARPTLVVVTGDHGEGARRSRRADARPLRLRIDAADPADHRRDRWRSWFDRLTTSVVVPLVLSWSKDERGEVSSVAARHVDILPTILEAVGQPLPADLPGRSLLPAAERRAGAPPRTSYFEAMGAMLNRGWAPLTGVLVDRDKFIDLPIAERYDLAADPGERVNLAGRAPERDRALAASLRAFDAAPPGERRAEEPRRGRRVCARSATSRAVRRRRRATPTPTIPSSSSISIRRFTTPSRRSARGGSTKRCGSIKA